MVLKRVLTKVDLPKPDSPGGEGLRERRGEGKRRMMERTDDHYGELEALPDALTMDLVGKIGKPDVSHEFLADDWGDTGSVVRKGGT